MIAPEALDALAIGPRLQVATLRRLEDAELTRLESILVDRQGRLAALEAPAKDQRTVRERIARVRQVLRERHPDGPCPAEEDEQVVTTTAAPPPEQRREVATATIDGGDLAAEIDEVCGDLEAPTEEAPATDPDPPTGADLAAEVSDPPDPERRAALVEQAHRALDAELDDAEGAYAAADAEGEDLVARDEAWAVVGREIAGAITSPDVAAWAARRLLRARAEHDREAEQLAVLRRRADGRLARLEALLEPALRAWAEAHPEGRDPRTRGTWRLPGTTATLRYRDVAARLVVEDADRVAEALADDDYEAACDLGALTVRHRASGPRLLAWLRARGDALADPDAPPETLPVGTRWQPAETRFYVQDR